LSALTDAILANAQVDVDLLTAAPEANDPATWTLPTAAGYAATRTALVCTLNQLPGGVCFEIAFAGPLLPGITVVVAWGIRLNGQVVCCGVFDSPILVSDQRDYQVIIEGQVNPVLF